MNNLYNTKCWFVNAKIVYNTEMKHLPMTNSIQKQSFLCVFCIFIY